MDNFRIQRAVAVFVFMGILVVPVEAQTLTIRGDEIPLPAQKVLREIMYDTGITDARITSTFRTPPHQVRAMAGFIHRHGVPAAYRLYGPEGDSIIASYAEHAHVSREQRRQAMLDVLLRVLPRAHANGRLMHTQDTHFVFDVAVRSIPKDKHEAFARSARVHPCVLRFLGFEEGEKGAFHLEVSESAPACK